MSKTKILREQVGLNQPSSGQYCQGKKWKISFYSCFNLFQNVHAPKNFPCNYCDKRFSTTYKMTSHQNQVHIKPIKYQCGACNFSCYRKEGLRAHIGKKQNNKNIIVFKLKSNFCLFQRLSMKREKCTLVRFVQRGELKSLLYTNSSKVPNLFFLLFLSSQKVLLQT